MKDEELRSTIPDTFDNTMLSTYSVCPRKLYWFLRGIRTTVDPAYFLFGRAWGRAQKAWHESQGTEAGPRERKNYAIDQARKLWEQEAPTELGDNTLSNFIEMIEIYTEIHEAPEQWEIIASEIGFREELSEGLFYAGALDAEISWEPYGILVKEDKTTGQYLSGNFMKQWDFATQVTGYQWGMEKILGKEIFGVLMNVASKRKRKEAELRFARDLQKRSKEALDTWEKDTTLLCKKIQEEWRVHSWLPLGMRNQTNCSGGIGKSPCDYAILCKDERPFWRIDPLKFQGFKEVSSWTPWERTGDDDD